jgi:VWFA-related protein
LVRSFTTKVVEQRQVPILQGDERREILIAMKGKLICSLTLVASALLAQAPAPNAGPSGLVRLSVAALDVSGEPVTDLKADEFQISDQGKPQRIAFFRANTSAPQTAPLGPHEYSNRSGPALPHSTVILFDLLNENQPDRLDVWHKLGRSLQELESGDSLYLYLLTLEGGLNPIHPIGGKPGDDQTWTQQVEKTLDKAMKAASHARPQEMSDMELVVKKTYVALETLANQLATLPGRRDIVWITSGMPNVWNPKTPCNGEWVDCALYVPHLSVTLEHDNVAVNPITYTSSPSPDMTRDLEQIAGLTGGWMYSGDEIRSVLKQVARDNAVSYSIYFDPGADNWDSKFHKVRVTLERKGIKVHVKQRYYALPDRRPEVAKQQAVLAAAYQNPSDDPAIGLRAAIVTDAGKTPQVQVRINLRDLLVREEGGVFAGGVALLISDVGAAGPVGEPAISTFELHLTREQHDAAMKDGLPIAQEHAVNASAQKVRILVLDQGSNTAGSITIPVGH